MKKKVSINSKDLEKMVFECAKKVLKESFSSSNEIDWDDIFKYLDNKVRPLSRRNRIEEILDMINEKGYSFDTLMVNGTDIADDEFRSMFDGNDDDFNIINNFIGEYIEDTEYDNTSSEEDDWHQYGPGGNPFDKRRRSMVDGPKYDR